MDLQRLLHSSSLLGCSCHHGWGLLFWLLESGSSSVCHLFVIFTMLPSRLVLLFHQVQLTKVYLFNMVRFLYEPSIIFHYLLDQNTKAFKEVAIIRHPRIGEYAFGFITSTVTLQVCYKNIS